MGLLQEEAHDEEQEDWSGWSGIPIYPGGRLMVVPIHIGDTQQYRFPGWEHINMQETERGDVEYHTYFRRGV